MRRPARDASRTGCRRLPARTAWSCASTGRARRHVPAPGSCLLSSRCRRDLRPSGGAMTAQEALGLGLQGSIMLTVLGFGLGATFAEANYLFHQPALLLRCVLSMNVVM